MDVDKSRRGVTLFEVMLTVGVLVLIAAISVPVISTMMANSRQTEARDFIQGALTQARSKAMEHGKPYRFEVTTSEYRIVPDDEEECEANELSGKKLPDNVCFCGSNTDGEQTSADSSWQTVATFLPNGTAEKDVEISFSVHNSAPTTLKLRAMTGAVTTAMLNTTSGH